MSDTLEQFSSIRTRAMQDLAGVDTAEQLEQYRIRYLSRKGEVTEMLSLLGGLPKELKPQGGKLANQIKTEVQQAFEQKKADLEQAGKKRTGPLFDVTLPGIPAKLGRPHLITQTIQELLEIFGRMGFEVGYGPEIEDEYHNFVALNIPRSHPARDPLDNFYIDENALLRSQTSTMQIRVMESR